MLYNLWHMSKSRTLNEEIMIPEELASLTKLTRMLRERKDRSIVSLRLIDKALKIARKQLEFLEKEKNKYIKGVN